MSSLQGNTRPISIGEAFIQGGSVGDGYEDYAVSIAQANSVDLLSVFKNYNVEIPEHERNIRCPFPNHNDQGPSLKYYPSTNSFHCFGCKTTGGPVKFISTILNISRSQSINILLNNFESDDSKLSVFIDFREREDLHLKFSTLIRNFIKSNNTDEAISMADKLSFVFDEANRKHATDIDGLKLIISKLELILNNYR